MKKIAEDLKKIIQPNKKNIFVCIGTKFSFYDGIAPRIGTFLEQNGEKVYGTEYNDINQQNFEERIQEIKNLHKNDFIIAIDLCFIEENEKILVSNRPVYPAKYTKQNGDVSIGDISILINIYPFIQTSDKKEVLKKICYETENVEFSRTEDELKKTLEKIFKKN